MGEIMNPRIEISNRNLQTDDVTKWTGADNVTWAELSSRCGCRTAVEGSSPFNPSTNGVPLHVNYVLFTTGVLSFTSTINNKIIQFGHSLQQVMATGGPLHVQVFIFVLNYVLFTAGVLLFTCTSIYNKVIQFRNCFPQVMATGGPLQVGFFAIVVFFGSFYLINLMLAVVAMSYEEEAENSEDVSAGWEHLRDACQIESPIKLCIHF